MPRVDSRADQDALIVESLCSFFRTRTAQVPVLYSCSENTHDFAIELEPQKGYSLHPMFRCDMPVSSFFTDLESLAEAVREQRMPADVTPKEVEEAIERERQYEERELQNLLRLVAQTCSITHRWSMLN